MARAYSLICAAIVAAIGLSAPASADDSPAAQCDAMAGSPDDLDLPEGATGIPFALIDPSEEAEAACLAASVEQPSQRRFLTHLGRLYAKRGDHGKALEAYRLAYGRGSAVAANNLGAMHRSGDGVPESLERSTHYVRKAAHRGLPYAMRTMGARSREGFGTPENLSMAVFWYERAAEAGDAVGTHDLGMMYRKGWGVREDDAWGFDLLAEALALDPGYALAAYNIAESYETGEGVETDLEQSRLHYERAAENGDGDGANEVGRFFAEGRGVDPDPEAAAEWYARGAALGSMAAMVSLGGAYQDGLGVSQDAAEAERLYREALELDPNDEWRAFINDRISALTGAAATD